MHACQERLKKIFFILPALTGGGAERVVLHILSHIDRSKYVPELYLFDRKGEFLEQMPEDMEVRILRDRRWKYRGFARMVYNLCMELRKERPDAIVSFTWYANAIALSASIFSRHKSSIIVSERTSFFTHVDYVEDILRRLIICLFYRIADIVVTPSLQMSKVLSEAGHVPSHLLITIPNPVDSERIRELSLEDAEIGQFSQGRPVIAGIGRMSIEKGFDFLIRAVGILRSEETDCCLILLGDGDQRRSLEMLASELGISESVLFLGFQQNPYKYLVRSTVLALPSLHEGFPNVLLEAMSLGVPVISTNCETGPAEIITDGKNGLLVPTGDEAALAAGIKRILLDSDMRKRYEAEGKRRAETYSVRKIVSQYEEAVEKACAASAAK